MNNLSRTAILLCTLLASIVLLLVLYVIMMIKVQTGALGVVGIVIIGVVFCIVAAAIYFQIKQDKAAKAEAPKDEPAA